MKNLSKIIIALILTAALAFTFVACSSASRESEEPGITESRAPAEDGGQNPVMNFIGNYYNGGAYILVEADGNDGARFTVDWGMTDDMSEQYTFSGTLDTDTLRVTYSNSTKRVLTLDSQGNVTDERTDYTDGSGMVIFHEDGTLEWHDENEADRMTDNTVFSYITVTE